MPVKPVPAAAPSRPSSTRTAVTRGGATVALATAALTAFLATWESGPKPQLVVYADSVANGVPTVCDGLTRAVTSVPIIVGERWTEEKCAQVQSDALVRMQRQLAGCFTFRGPVPQAAFDMASSHAWNNGAPNTCSSLAMEAFNRGEWELGCRRLSQSDAGRPVWSSVRTGKTLPNGQPEFRFVQGLANRRGAETRECLKGLT